VLEQYPETVKIVFKNYPLKNHKFAKPAALAALAAHEQGKFWEFHDLLFKNVHALNINKINEIAKEVQLDITRFTKDSASPAVHEKLSRDMQDGNAAGVSGTPALFVNGRRVKKGAMINTIIQEELLKALKTK
jgi:protein-disulfide isomerase